MRLEQKHQLDDVMVDWSADAARMAFYQIFLECGKLIMRNMFAAKRSETGGDAIDRLGRLVGFAIEEIATMLDLLASIVREGEFGATLKDMLDKIVG